MRPGQMRRAPESAPYELFSSHLTFIWLSQDRRQEEATDVNGYVISGIDLLFGRFGKSLGAPLQEEAENPRKVFYQNGLDLKILYSRHVWQTFLAVSIV
jgi:hypothetical protein